MFIFNLVIEESVGDIVFEQRACGHSTTYFKAAFRNVSKVNKRKCKI